MRIEAIWEKKQEYIPVVMVREDLTDLPAYPLPEGYRLRYYRAGEDHLWAEIEVAVASFDSMDGALAGFEREFGAGRDRMEERCLYLEAPDGRVIGTSTAWYNDAFNGRTTAASTGSPSGRSIRAGSRQAASGGIASADRGLPRSRLPDHPDHQRSCDQPVPGLRLHPV